MERKIYEITYWLRINAKSEEVEEKILDLFKKYNFELIKKIPAKTKNLAYPIGKETSGQLGTIYFYGSPDQINFFKNDIQSFKEILRFIILRRKFVKEILLEEKTSSEEKVVPVS